MRLGRRGLLGAGLALAAQGGARAAEFPDRPLRVIVPFGPGGANDIVGRMVATRLTQTLGQPVVVENRGGASGAIGSVAAARAAPDGYTMLMGSTTTISILPQIDPGIGYDPERDLLPLSLAGYSPHVLLVTPGLAATSVPELVALARGRTNPLTFADGGFATPHYLAGELFRRAVGIELTHVPYRGGGDVLNDLVAGHTEFASVEFSSAAPLVRDGRLRAIGIASAARLPGFPGIPTVIEQGVPGFEITSWYGFLGVAGTPAPIADRLSAEIAQAMQDPGIRERLGASSTTVVGSDAAGFRAHIAREQRKWGDAIRQARA